MVKCDICKARQTIYYVTSSGKRYCRGCFDNTRRTCEYCNITLPKRDTVRIKIDGHLICLCRRCIEMQVHDCIDCGEKTLSMRTREDDNKGFLCSGCTQNYEHCSLCDKYRKNMIENEFTGRHFCNTECQEKYYVENYTARYSYHSDYGRMDLSKNSLYRVGVEIEKEDGDILYNDNTFDSNATKLEMQTGWIIEEDGSLDEENGYELISPILDLMNREQCNESIDSVAEYINAGQSSHCGGHIHFSEKDKTPLKLMREVKGYFPLLYALWPKRTDNSYCEVRPSSQYGTSRYAINLTNYTVEIRLPPSPRDADTLKWRLELLRIMLNKKADKPSIVINLLTNRKTSLNKHMTKVYTQTEIMRKIQMLSAFSSTFERDDFTIEHMLDAHSKLLAYGKKVKINRSK